MNNEKIMIMRLQDNLSTIRKLGGWTTQELGEKIGVTKQTISNLENKKSTMTKLQYIGLRSILDREANSDAENSNLLKKSMEILLDAELTQEEQQEYEEKIKLAAAAIAGGATIETVTKSVGIEKGTLKDDTIDEMDTIDITNHDPVLIGTVTTSKGKTYPIYSGQKSSIPQERDSFISFTAKWLNRLMDSKY